MEIIVLLISISVFIALAFLAVFYWNYKSGQYDDTYTPSIRMLFDDHIKRTVNSKVKPPKKEKSI
jgi:cbb3-type cytochrome oxidase maturation protein